MSSSARPVTPARFAEALEELPLATLHNTAAEIRNSKSHLEYSNKELQPHADEGDQVCKEAITENEQVLERMDGRLNLLRAEVERRGMPWVEDDLTKEGGEAVVNGHGDSGARAHHDEIGPNADTRAANPASQSQTSELLSDEELRRRMEERLLADEDDGTDEQDGVHL